MSNPEKVEQNKINLWMRFILPNDTSREDAIRLSEAVARFKFEDVEISDEEGVRVGTIVEFPISISGVKEPKPDRDLTSEERQAKDWENEYLVDVEIEGDY